MDGGVLPLCCCCGFRLLMRFACTGTGISYVKSVPVTVKGDCVWDAGTLGCTTRNLHAGRFSVDIRTTDQSHESNE